MGEYHWVLLIDLSKKMNAVNVNQTAQRVTTTGLKWSPNGKPNEHLVRTERQDDWRTQRGEAEWILLESDWWPCLWQPSSAVLPLGNIKSLLPPNLGNHTHTVTKISKPARASAHPPTPAQGVTSQLWRVCFYCVWCSRSRWRCSNLCLYPQAPMLMC